jgi:nucleoside-diphosphate-sugar epimerase
VRAVTGDLLSNVPALTTSRHDVVFHLAAATSAECEANFDLGMRSNIDTTRGLLDGLRLSGSMPRFIFASSVAVFGGTPYHPLPEFITDATAPLPQSSYGIQKFICEQLVSDYSRRGFIDGRVARLMTVAVRPGRPNGAASSFLSSIVREPLHGETAICPVPLEMSVAVASPDRAIEGLLAVAEADPAVLAGQRTINLPALTVRVGEILDTLQAVGGPAARALVREEIDPAIQRIVGAWPARFATPLANRLGLQHDPDIRSIVDQFVSTLPSPTQ